MKEIINESKVNEIMGDNNVHNIREKSKEYKATLIANSIIKRVDKSFTVFRDRLIIDIYHEVLNELRNK